MSADVIYKIAERWITCHDCAGLIRPGNGYAMWREHISKYPYKSESIWRHYCIECGPLLEDSLTTTKDVK
jgi:hypothetical protein